MLTLATIFWGLSFPLMKAFTLIAQEALPAANTWFITGTAVFFRFAIAALLVIAWSWRTLTTLSRLEVWQGFGLGFFGAAGLILQMDGLAYTEASTSAFLTQAYCLILPFAVAFRDRLRPSGWILFCSALMLAGVAVLAKIDWRHFHVGRGELETLIGSVFFAGQILWLERPVFRQNRVGHFTLAMFASMACFALPVILFNANSMSDILAPMRSPTAISLIVALVLFCTLIAFLLMNRWQPHIPAAEAGLIYGAEPVFATIFALMLPAWISKLADIDYANESFTRSFLVGAALIIAANVLLQLRSLLSRTDTVKKPLPHPASSEATPSPSP